MRKIVSLYAIRYMYLQKNLLSRQSLSMKDGRRTKTGKEILGKEMTGNADSRHSLIRGESGEHRAMRRK